MPLASDEAVPRVAVQLVQGCLVVPVQIDLYEQTLALLRRDLLEAARRSGARDAVIDLSGVAVLDRFGFDHLVQTAVAADLMGVRTCFAGVRAPVAACLIGLGVDVDELRIERSVEAALDRFRLEREPPADAPGEEAPGEEAPADADPGPDPSPPEGGLLEAGPP